MHDLPRKLSVDQLAVLLEGRSRFVERLAEVENPLGTMRALLNRLPEEERIELLNGHPRIGERGPLSPLSAAEQSAASSVPEVLAELQRLNDAYEAKFGFRFIVFVKGRRKAEILDVLRERIHRTRTEEMATALDELVAIAQDRYRKHLSR